MPELPEVEVLVRHLAPVLRARRIRAVTVYRRRVIRPTPPRRFAEALVGATFETVRRRGKYLLFSLHLPAGGRGLLILGHLGMTGRMYVLPKSHALPKHAAIVFTLGGEQQFVFEDTRYFGRLTLDTRALSRLGPEPLGARFTPGVLSAGLARSSQPVKVKLLDQALLAGVGNIYASEALFHARISPLVPADTLQEGQVLRLWRGIREVLRQAIRWGSTVRLDWSGEGPGGGLFYYGRAKAAPDPGAERLQVYDRAGKPCVRCGTSIRRVVQAARSTYYCPRCQALDFFSGQKPRAGRRMR